MAKVGKKKIRRAEKGALGFSTDKESTLEGFLQKRAQVAGTPQLEQTAGQVSPTLGPGTPAGMLPGVQTQATAGGVEPTIQQGMFGQPVQGQGELSQLLGAITPQATQAAQGFLGQLQSFSPQEAAQQEFQNIQEILAPQREQQRETLEERLFRQGRLGSTGGGVEQEAFGRAVQAQDVQLATQALDRARSAQQGFLGLAQGLTQLPAQIAQQTGQLGLSQRQQRLSALSGMFNQLVQGEQLGLGTEQQAFQQQLARQQAAQQFQQGMFGQQFDLAQLGFSQQQAIEQALQSRQQAAASQQLSLADLLATNELNRQKIKAGKSGFLEQAALGAIQGGSQAAGAAMASSDAHLKENITPLTKIGNIPFYKYKWKNTDKWDVGVIAQEIKNILPEAVSIMPNNYLGVNYNMLLGGE